MAGAGDSFGKARGAAAFAIGQLSEHCQPETGQKARSVLPAVFKLINDQNPDVQEQAYYALQTFCDSLGDPSTHCKVKEKAPYLGLPSLIFVAHSL